MLDLIQPLGVQINPTTIIVIVVAVVLIAACAVLGVISKKNKK